MEFSEFYLTIVVVICYAAFIAILNKVRKTSEE
jgi:hypothetical protein